MSLRLVIALLITTACGVGAWGDIRYQVRDVRKEVEGLRTEFESTSQDRWHRIDDVVFMRDFANVNGLKMVPHISLEEAASLGDGTP